MDIVVWLRSLGLGKYEAGPRENEIDDDGAYNRWRPISSCSPEGVPHGANAFSPRYSHPPDG